MADFLSDAWFEEACRQLEASPVAPAIEPPGWEIRVATADRTNSPIEYRITFAGDTVTLSRSPSTASERPWVQFDVDGDTARDIASGTLSAQRAFMSGTLRVTGDVGLLIEHSTVLSGFTALFDGSPPSPAFEGGLGDPRHA